MELGRRESRNHVLVALWVYVSRVHLAMAGNLFSGGVSQENITFHVLLPFLPELLS